MVKSRAGAWHMAGKIRQGRRSINFDRKQVRSVPLQYCEAYVCLWSLAQLLGQNSTRSKKNKLNRAARPVGFLRLGAS
jgi:hypothetical protein